MTISYTVDSSYYKASGRLGLLDKHVLGLCLKMEFFFFQEEEKMWWQNPWPHSANELLILLMMSKNLPCSFPKVFAQLIPQSDGQVLSFKCLHPSFVSCAQNAAYITSKLGLKSAKRLKNNK